MNDQGNEKETYMTIEDVAAYLKLAEQTIRKYVLNKSIPYRKVKKSVRFRLSEIEKWIDAGGGDCPNFPNGSSPLAERQGDLFSDREACDSSAADTEGEV